MSGLVKLLVIDDEPELGVFVSNIAGSLGMDAVSVCSANEVIDTPSIDSDIIVLDLFMPDMDGIELMRKLADKGNSASFILISGVDKGILHSAEELARELGLSVLGRLSKPFRARELRNLLSNFKHVEASAFAGSNEIPSAEELAVAIEEGQIYVVFQPKVSLKTGELVGAESLVRWNHPQKGFIPPGFFIPMAEDNDLILPLTRIVMTESIRHMAEWESMRGDFKLSINLSPAALTDLGWPDFVDREIRKYNISPKHFVFEITETAVTRDVAAYLEILARFRMKGFGLSIDDFGTGYSSLLQLVRIPFSELKIDQAFITDITRNAESMTIARLTIALATELGMTVVAEGIEDVETCNMLSVMNCDIGQGYFLGRPMLADKFLAWDIPWQP